MTTTTQTGTTQNLAAPSGTFAIGGEMPVVRLGYGTMQLPGEGVWGPPRDHAAAVAVLRRAVEIGVTFFDTADSYGPEVAEDLLRDALHPYADDVVIATKAGLTRQGPGVWTPVGRPAYLRQQCELSLRRLGVEQIDLFQLHRIDADVPLEDQVGELKKLQDEGKVRHIGLSEVDVDAARGGAQDRHHRHGPEPLQPRRTATPSRCSTSARRTRSGSSRGSRWPPASCPRRTARSPTRRAPTTRPPRSSPWPGCSQRSPVMLPIPGTKSIDHLESNTAAAGIELTDDEFEALTAAV